MSRVLSFGEIIWDVYQDSTCEGKALIGGAPLNFAAHVGLCGQESYLISAVGADSLGDRALATVDRLGVHTRFIRRAAHATGTCLVTLDGRGVPCFDVQADTAYDHIELSDGDMDALRALSFDALYFGTLIQRSPTSRATLRRLCAACQFDEIVCDINLRRDCYDRDSAEFCLRTATILKVSEEEEPILREMGLYACPDASPEAITREICAAYPTIRCVLLTCGERGAYAYTPATKELLFEAAKPVTVASTVGAGDSFIAAFVSAFLNRAPLREALRFGTELSGLVVSRPEAIPRYRVEEGSILPPLPLLQAHRGVAAEYPENTMVAFRAAIKQGYAYIELDPAYTADGEILVLHDATLNRTARRADGSPLEREIRLCDISAEEALTYDYGVSFALRFRGEGIPTLSDALALARASGVKVKIDNKVERFPEAATAALHTILEQFGDTVALTSGKPEMIERYAVRFPQAELHYDGPVDSAVLERLAPLSDRLTVWLPHKSPRTAWVKVPFADEALCAQVKQHARLGIWIIGDEASFEQVCRAFAPDLVETTGVIKPARARGAVYDLHVHTHSSHDGHSSVAACAAACAAKGFAGFAVTDHLDVHACGERDVLSCIDASATEAWASKDHAPVRILAGVEIGDGIRCEACVEEILARHHFDVVLGSVHAVRYRDLWYPFSRIDFSGMDDGEIHGYLEAYFDDLLETVERIPCDVVAHLSCPLRYVNERYGRGVDAKRYEDKIQKILRAMIVRGLALELNTSCEGFFMPEDWIVETYRAMGGYLITLASDAHYAENMGVRFDAATALLKRLGFRHLYRYEDRIGIQCDI